MGAFAVMSILIASARAPLMHLRSECHTKELRSQVWCYEEGCKNILSFQAMFQPIDDWQRSDERGVTHRLHHFLDCLCTSNSLSHKMQAGCSTMHTVCRPGGTAFKQVSSVLLTMLAECLLLSQTKQALFNPLNFAISRKHAFRRVRAPIL